LCIPPWSKLLLEKLTQGFPEFCGILCELAFRKVDQKYVESSEMRCCRGVEKIGWTDRVRNVEVSSGVKGQRNILYTLKIRKANLIGYILRRNWLLKHVIEGKIERRIEVMERRRRRRKKLLDDFKEKR
jgi:hypothetical protein